MIRADETIAGRTRQLGELKLELGELAGMCARLAEELTEQRRVHGIVAAALATERDRLARLAAQVARDRADHERALPREGEAAGGAMPSRVERMAPSDPAAGMPFSMLRALGPRIRPRDAR